MSNEPTELQPDQQQLPQRTPRSRTELDLMDIWTWRYGDKGTWPETIARAFDNTLQLVRTGGAA